MKKTGSSAPVLLLAPEMVARGGSLYVVDLAVGHLKALEKLATQPGVALFNLGTGRGYSVLEVVKAFETASGKEIPYSVIDRRPGDVAISFADSSKAAKDLEWRADKSIDRMCTDAWRWQTQNPHGY